MKYILLCAFLAFTFGGKAQTTTYTIDYSYESLGTACNVFGTSQTVDTYVHQTTKGFPTFVGNPDYYVSLPCKRNSFTSQVGTDYQIIFPFKKDYKYQVNVYYKGTITSPGELYPNIALALNPTKKAQNTSTSCSGPQSINQFDYWFEGPAGPSFAWAASPMLNTNALPQNYESLSIASIPWPGSSATGTQAIHVRKIQITEIPPPPSVTITNNTISFATPFQYMEDISVTGTTPTISSGTYTYEWVMSGNPIVPQTNTLNNYAAAIFQNEPALVNQSLTLQRKITSSTGVVSLSNTLNMPRPSSNIALAVAELPGNPKNGTKFIAGSTANFTISNPTPGVKYVWYYHHRYAPSNAGFVLVPTPAAGTNYSIVVGNYLPFSPAFFDQLTVFGSDGSWGIYHFYIAP